MDGQTDTQTDIISFADAGGKNNFCEQSIPYNNQKGCHICDPLDNF